MSTIGILVESAEYTFGRELIRGALEATQGTDHRIVVFSSGSITSYLGFETQRRFLRAMVSSRTLDGLILEGGLSHFAGLEELVALCGSFAPLPIISLEVALPQIPSIVTDNRGGMAQLMDHLLDHHGYRRLAFLGGPPGQQEAEMRQEVFLQKTAQAGCLTRPEWIVHGNFLRLSGFEAARALWTTQDAHPDWPPFEVIVGANDEMVQGALEYMAQSGRLGPGHAAVTGFDDMPESAVLDPPLTTVRQSPFLMAKAALQNLLQAIEGKDLQTLTVFPAELVIRQSCGCPPENYQGRTNEELLAALETLRHAGLHDSRERIQVWNLSYLLRGLNETLQASDSLAQLVENLASDLRQMTFSRFWFSSFSDPREDHSAARLHLAWEQAGDAEVSLEGREYLSSEVVPGGVDTLPVQDHLLVVEPLVSPSQMFGFVVFSTDLAGSRSTSAIRGQITGAFQVVRLIEQQRETERRMLNSEKLAALGSLVAGVAHEINTPLGVSITGVSLMNDEIRALQRSPGSEPMTAAAYQRSVNSLEAAGNLTLTNLMRAAELVSNFKQVSVDQTSEQRRVFEAKEYIEEILIGLQFHWRDKPIELVITGPDKSRLDSYPGAMVQVITHLVSNSLLHAFPEGYQGRISILLEEKGETLALCYSDNGTGIPLPDQPRIFEPFFTTKRGKGGTGLGLHVVFNVVTQRLGGTITFRSLPNAGTTFDLLIPRRAPDRSGANSQTHPQVF